MLCKEGGREGGREGGKEGQKMGESKEIERTLTRAYAASTHKHMQAGTDTLKIMNLKTRARAR